MARGNETPAGLQTSDLLRRVEDVLAQSVESFLKQQQPDGHWVFELEADTTIPSEYIMLNHFLDLREPEVEQELAAYIQSRQQEGGGWPLFHGGEMDLSASVKAYLALKLAGHAADAPHMARARSAILARGGAERANVFTRYALALYGEVPWRAVPVMPVELMLMPGWFPVTLAKVSYWSRTVIAPLLVLAALKPVARNPLKVSIRELFYEDPETIRDYIRPKFHTGWEKFFLAVDRLLRKTEPHFPKRFRRKAIARAVAFFTERLNGEDGLGAIFPAMANSVMAMDALGYSRQHPHFKTALASVRKLVSWSEKPRFVQPCLSPVWDTSLGLHALMEAGVAPKGEEIGRACQWLKTLQVLDVAGDWAAKKPDVRPGGWAFQYRNDYYPDLDDTAVVVMALHRADAHTHAESIRRAEEWITGMQSENGGFAAFDVDNTAYYLNNIPFADHGALLDPPTEDVTARCVSMLAQLGHGKDSPVMARAISYLEKTQQPDGSWFGRWGTNYIYGTWSVLSALNAAGVDKGSPMMRKGVEWLLSRQQTDGGWGEDGGSYWQETRPLVKASTASQTAWALLGLMAAGEVANPAVKKGVAYLTEAKRIGSKWEEPWF
ncbi:MAG TPA: squalene--hopene cyclase, partial [Sphingomonadales bacterium]|nr:squalene--hopene cyclase [Sphingomonadales bacterium]